MDDAIDASLLIPRLVTGGLLAGHGAQKLLGAFGGPGLEKTSGMMESLGLKPGGIWGPAAAISELAGGALTALGLLNPIGPVATVAAMTMAATTAHWGKPIWATSGGAELAVTNLGVAAALGIAGPGRYSLDEALGIRLPGWLRIATLGAAAAGVAYALYSRSSAGGSAE
ncbi:MAG: DoxX family protein [Chloroflexi bacterium]|nr:DoxX family protein [Chloroflexota bacterium]